MLVKIFVEGILQRESFLSFLSLTLLLVVEILFRVLLLVEVSNEIQVQALLKFRNA